MEGRLEPQAQALLRDGSGVTMNEGVAQERAKRLRYGGVIRESVARMLS